MTVTCPLPAREGDVIAGKYRITRVLGAGAMGVVVAAEHIGLGRLVALKCLHSEACENEQAISRFMREGQVLAQIASPHVAQVLDVGTLTDGTPYLVMEYLEGSDFGALLKARGPLPISEAAGYLMQVCEGVAVAHANGIVHRDLKPSNLFLARSPDGEPIAKVLDFGISKSIASRGLEFASYDNTSTGALVGSPQYMSPEQIRNAKRVDLRTDIWSLGVILHELLTSSLPFKGESLAGILAAIAADRPVPIRAVRPDVSADLEAVILRCLSKDRDQRYASIGELARALKPFTVGEARHSVSRIERLLRGSSSVNPETDVTRQTESIATVPPWEDHPAPQLSRVTVWPAAAVVVLLLTGGAIWWALGSHGSAATSQIVTSSMVMPNDSAALRVAVVPPPGRSDAGALTKPERVASQAPAATPNAVPVRGPSHKVSSQREAVARPPAPVAPTPAAIDDEGTADRK